MFVPSFSSDIVKFVQNWFTSACSSFFTRLCRCLFGVLPFCINNVCELISDDLVVVVVVVVVVRFSLPWVVVELSDCCPGFFYHCASCPRSRQGSAMT